MPELMRKADAGDMIANQKLGTMFCVCESAF